jgi:light-regulated signal transduction histidine kinase (bacteriophytochrome)
MAEFIVEGAARMPALIDDLLSFANSGVHEAPRCVDLQNVVTKALQNLAPAITASSAMVTVDRLAIVHSNELNLVRLFQNLISNAVKYRREDPVEIHTTAKQHGPDCVIGIEDNGVGIVAESQARVSALEN